MTTPRSVQIDLSMTPYYHCIARCVRRSYLCGYDQLSNKDFSHRRGWVVERIKHLSKVFYINICAYAIMTNHYHVVLHVDWLKAKKASLDQLLGRWNKIFPTDAKRLTKLVKNNPEHMKEEVFSLLVERLSSISWYMRCLNESIAKMANKEDNCTGRFWEGRFKSQALLDEGALLSTMVYVDLNPIRAGMANTPETSEFTSIYERLEHYTKTKNSSQPHELVPFYRPNVNLDGHSIDFSIEDYFTLVDSTGREIREGKRGTIPQKMAPIFERLNLTVEGWSMMVEGIEDNFYYAIGSPDNLKEFIPGLHLRRSKCLEFVEECYQDVAA